MIKFATRFDSRTVIEAGRAGRPLPVKLLCSCGWIFSIDFTATLRNERPQFVTLEHVGPIVGGREILRPTCPNCQEVSTKLEVPS